MSLCVKSKSKETLLKFKTKLNQAFSEIIKLQVEKEPILCYVKAFLELILLNISEKCVATPNFLFWMLEVLTKIYFSRIIINCAKSLYIRLGTVFLGLEADIYDKSGLKGDINISVRTY